MNTRQRLFCQEYASSGNATKSALAVGYSPKTARQIGQRLLTNVDIQDYIAELSEQIKSEKIADVVEMQITLTSILRGEMLEEVPMINKLGEAVLIEKTPSIKDKMRASELLMKVQGCFNNKIQLEMCLPVFGGEDELED